MPKTHSFQTCTVQVPFSVYVVNGQAETGLKRATRLEVQHGYVVVQIREILLAQNFISKLKSGKKLYCSTGFAVRILSS